MSFLPIIALDPAGPIFDGNSPSSKLQPGDARIVEALHSGMPLTQWSIGQMSRGIKEALGTKDIYINGGGVHPACDR